MRNHPENTTSDHPIEMYVTKRNGEKETVNLDKILAVINEASHDLGCVDPMRIATKTINGLVNGTTTIQLDKLAISTAASLVREEPEYDILASRLQLRFVREEAKTEGIVTFWDSIQCGRENGIINQRLYDFVKRHKEALLEMIDDERDELFELFGLSTLYDRYLLKHPKSRLVIETPQHFFMRIACALSRTIEEVQPFYEILSRLEYLPSSPTLFNSGTTHEQLSSCFLLDSPQDDLESIYDRYKEIAMLSKFSGGIGIAYHRVRSDGSHIKGTNGLSDGIIPWINTLDASVAAVNQGGRRKGACCVYLEPWHADIYDFIELRKNAGEEKRRARTLYIALWVCDLFMKRLQEKGSWSLFDPKDVPELPDLYGEAFEEAYVRAEKAGLAKRVVPAEELYRRIIEELGQTGTPWFTFKDRSNKTCNQTNDDLITDPKEAHKNRVVHLSNLCTEIIEVSSNDETAVCNLGSVNLSRHVAVDEDGNPYFDYEKLGKTVEIAVRHLDRVIDLNYYPTEQARRSNAKWRPIGLGLMGLHDVFFKMHEPFDSPKAREISRRVSEEIYYHALKTSCKLAREYGRHETFAETRTAQGVLQFDFWETKPADMTRWDALREEVKEHGLRNSLLCAIAPTATIASIAGCSECIEPMNSNFFKRETLTGEFIVLNKYLVADLKKAGMWDDDMRTFLNMTKGSVKYIERISPELRKIYRTAWEMPMKSLIQMAAERGAFIDQSQSLNLFMESPSIDALSAMYFYAWKSGVKTTYYLRSRPATDIGKSTVTEGEQARINALIDAAKANDSSTRGATTSSTTVSAPTSCSLANFDTENPDYCEACQ